MEDNLWYVLGIADQVIQIVREGVRRSSATVCDISSNKVAVADVYDEIVFVRTLIAFDDLGEILQKDELRKIIIDLDDYWRTSRDMYFTGMRCGAKSKSRCSPCPALRSELRKTRSWFRRFPTAERPKRPTRLSVSCPPLLATA